MCTLHSEIDTLFGGESEILCTLFCSERRQKDLNLRSLHLQWSDLATCPRRQKNKHDGIPSRADEGFEPSSQTCMACHVIFSVFLKLHPHGKISMYLKKQEQKNILQKVESISKSVLNYFLFEDFAFSLPNTNR